MRDVLRRLIAGELSEEDALAELRRLQLDELGGRARLDLGRYLRRGIPEVVLATGKSPEETGRLAVALAERQGQGLVSRMSDAHESALRDAAARASMALVRYHSSARVIREGFTPEPVAAKATTAHETPRLRRPERAQGEMRIASLDQLLPADRQIGHERGGGVVEACGIEARLEADLGVAGLHRFVGPLAAMLEWGADVIVVAAGMDGVLPGLVSGLIELPVIGLPVSTGYGRGGAGEAALTTMLQSCSTGLTVVNIDNGVGAGAAAALIAGRVAQGRRRGRSTATMASTIAPAISKPNTTPATVRDASAPPGIAKRAPKPKITTRTAASSHGKPRRRRP